MAKVFKITQRTNRGRVYTQEGTLSELISAYSYTLSCGKSYEYERGNKKINCNPKSIKALVTNLYNAKNNSAGNGYSGSSFSYEEL